MSEKGATDLASQPTYLPKEFWTTSDSTSQTVTAPEWAPEELRQMESEVARMTSEAESSLRLALWMLRHFGRGDTARAQALQRAIEIIEGG